MILHRLLSAITRQERSKLNENFDRIERSYRSVIDTSNDAKKQSNDALGVAKRAESKSDGAVYTAGYAKITADATAQQLENIIIESGTSDAEVVAARTNSETGISYPTLSKRIEGEVSSIIELTTKKHWVDAREFNVVSDFDLNEKTGTDNWQALKSAADKANELDVPLYIPTGRFLINTNESIVVKTDIICDGELYTPALVQKPLLVVERHAIGDVVELLDLTDLTKNSTKITNLAAYRDCDIALKSTEELIKRRGGGAFTKNDIFRVADNVGTLSSVLDCTYTDLNKLTVTAYKKERKLQIRGLRIYGFEEPRSVGEITPAKTAVQVKRSDVEFANCEVASIDNFTWDSCIYVLDALNHTFYNCTIGNCRYQLGYGITLSNTDNTMINNCKFNDVRHAVSGRHTKNVTINSCVTDSDFDTHWGNNFTVTNCVCSGIVFAGTDLTVRDTTIINAPIAINLRDGEPEFFGTLIFSGCKVKTNTSTSSLIAYGNANNDFDYGRTLSMFDFIDINNITIDAVNAPYIFMWLSGQRDYLQDVPRKVSVANVLSIHSKPLHFTTTRDYSKVPNRRDTIIAFDGIDFGGTNVSTATAPLVLTDVNTGGYSYGFDILIRNCRRVAFRIDPSLVKKMVADNSDIVFVRKRFDGRARMGRMYFYGCRFYSTYFETETNYVFLNCLFDGTITNLSAFKVDYANGCYSTDGTTGFNITNGLAQNGFTTNNLSNQATGA